MCRKETSMTKLDKARQRFKEIADSMGACTASQALWKEEDFQRYFRITKDEALKNSVKVLSEQLASLKKDLEEI